MATTIETVVYQTSYYRFGQNEENGNGDKENFKINL